MNILEWAGDEPFWTIFGLTAAALFAGALALHAIPRLGAPGKKLADALTRAPGLDVVIIYFTLLPWLAGAWVGSEHPLAGSPALGGLLGVAAAVGGQIVAMLAWCRAHELRHAEVARGVRIVKSLNRAVGPFRNHAAVWWTAWAVPLFTLVRLAQLLVYPPLTWLVRLPKYRTAEWVCVSRHKFTGLVGHDRVWCLYCDWMTGVWSLGSEMLRNVESFWCPIRFSSTAKCDNCKIDFPDINGGWAPADGTIADAVAAVEKHYPGPPDHGANGENGWFGHPARLTVNGRTPTR